MKSFVIWLCFVVLVSVVVKANYRMRIDAPVLGFVLEPAHGRR